MDSSTIPHKLLDISTKKHPDTYAIVDAEDYDRASQHKWHYDKGYVRRTYKVPCENTKRKKPVHEYLHHFIAGFPAPGFIVDHQNRNMLDNRKSNLRHCKRGHNQANKCGFSKKSRFKGIMNAHGAFVAQCGHHSDRGRISGLSSPQEAAVAYDEMAMRKFGRFAKLNFPCLMIGRPQYLVVE